MKCDKNLVPLIIEGGIYIERDCRDQLYQRDTYKYLPPALAMSKMSVLTMKVGAWITRHTEQLNRTGKLFLTKNLKDNVDPGFME